jgi:RNA polymerase sigma factor (sigma-70 family)
MHTDKFNIIIPPQDIDQNSECLTRIAAGDSQAFDWLYKNYCKRVFDLAFLLTANHAQSDDIVQEVFLKIWMHKEKLVEVRCFNSWLHIIIKNHITDYWRGEKKERIGRQKVAAFQPTVMQPHVYTNEDKQIIAAAVSNLSPRQRLVYKLIREEGFTRMQVSEGLGITPCTVKATMQNALASLRLKLK